MAIKESTRAEDERLKKELENADIEKFKQAIQSIAVIKHNKKAKSKAGHPSSS